LHPINEKRKHIQNKRPQQTTQRAVRNCATRDGENAGDFQNDILWRRPAVELAGETNADDFRRLELPRQAGHNVDRIGAADADGDHAETAGVWRVRIGTDHQTARKRIVFKQNLMNNARTCVCAYVREFVLFGECCRLLLLFFVVGDFVSLTWLPKTDAVLRTGTGKKIVHLFVGLGRSIEILFASILQPNGDVQPNTQKKKKKKIKNLCSSEEVIVVQILTRASIKWSQ
jgi:hypothetical protein